MRKRLAQLSCLVGRSDIQKVPRLAVVVVSIEGISLVFYYLAKDMHQVWLNCQVHNKWCIVADELLRFIDSNKIGNHIICFVPHWYETPFPSTPRNFDLSSSSL